jgi:hypothetical protein
VAEEDCRPQVQACAIRVARLDPTGVPQPGAENLYVSDALVSLAFAAVFTDGDEIKDKTACGSVGVNFKGDDSFDRGDVTITIITPDPFLSALLSGGDVLDVVGLPAGFAAPPIGPITGNGVSIELWAKRVDDGDLDADFPYAHWAYPKIKNLRIGDHTHANASLQPVFTGRALENPNWFDGPVGDWDAASDRVYQWLPSATIPTPSCAYQALVAS